MSDFPFQNNYDFLVHHLGYVIEREPNASWRIDSLVNPHYHIIVYCISGEATYHFGGKSHHIQQGDIMFFPKKYLHAGYSNHNNPWSFCSVAFDVDFCNENETNASFTIPKLIHSTNLHKMPILFSELNHTWLGKRTGYLIKSRSILMEILYLVLKEVDLSTNQNAHAQEIENVLNMIHDNYTNSYSIDDLAKFAGLSSSHFRVLFKKITGVTSIQYQNNIKINKAKELLLSGDCNVSEAADSVGFNDIYYFSRLFKKTTGMNPSNYLRI